MNNQRPRSLRREFRRWLLIRRARRVRIERQFQDLDDMLAKIRIAEENRPPWQRRLYADDVE